MGRLVVVVTGGREYDDWRTVEDAIDVLHHDQWDERVLVHGDCRGLDRLAGEAARRRGWTVVPVPAQWKRPDGSTDRAAGFKRNELMARRAMASREQGDRVIVLRFPGGNGTAHMADFSARLGLQVIEAELLVRAWFDGEEH